MLNDHQSLATGRTRSLFDEDMELCRPAIASSVRGARVLAIGAAGSIGSATVLTLLRHGPKAMHVIDQNENGLAELIRRVRARPDNYSCEDIKALPLDFGSHALWLFLRSEAVYDLVLNFAAIKHVRSEKDPFSTLQMLDTNIVKQARLMDRLAQCGFRGRFFTVSTDKAANPTSMMGATKRVMEHAMFNSAVAHALVGGKTAARFANVAFSNGSLLESFISRLSRGEPLAVPRDTRRYFVSLEEAGQICCIAACFPPSGSIVIPKLDPRDHLILLEHVAERFLAAHGYVAVPYDDETAACADVARLRASKRWPLLLTPLDTSGEKPYEEFMTEREEAFEIGLPNLKAVRYLPADAGAIDRLIARASSLVLGADESSRVDKDEIKRIIASVEPAFLATHRESAKNLDQRL